MTYHYGDIKTEWVSSGNGVIGYDVPILLASEYPQAVMLATVALGIGYHIGMAEAERKQGRKKNEH